MGELDYFSAGVGLYAFLLSIKVESVDFFCFLYEATGPWRLCTPGPGR